MDGIGHNCDKTTISPHVDKSQDATKKMQINHKIQIIDDNHPINEEDLHMKMVRFLQHDSFEIGSPPSLKELEDVKVLDSFKKTVTYIAKWLALSSMASLSIRKWLPTIPRRHFQRKCVFCVRSQDK